MGVLRRRCQAVLRAKFPTAYHTRSSTLTLIQIRLLHRRMLPVLRDLHSYLTPRSRAHRSGTLLHHRVPSGERASKLKRGARRQRTAATPLHGNSSARSQGGKNKTKTTATPEPQRRAGRGGTRSISLPSGGGGPTGRCHTEHWVPPGGARNPPSPSLEPPWPGLTSPPAGSAATGLLGSSAPPLQIAPGRVMKKGR